MRGTVTPEGNTFLPATESELSRFFSMVRKEDDAISDLERKLSGVIYPAEVKGGCWIWAGARDKRTGYGVFRAGGKVVKAHRWFFEQREKRAIAPKMHVHHLCHDPRVCKYAGPACPHTACVRHTVERSPFENTAVGARARPQPRALPPLVTPIQAKEGRVTRSLTEEVMEYLPRGTKLPYKVRELEALGVWQVAVSRWEAANRAKLGSRPRREAAPREGERARRRPAQGPDDMVHDPVRLGDYRFGQCSLVRCLVDYVDVAVGVEPVTWIRLDPVLRVPHSEVCCRVAAAMKAELPVDLGLWVRPQERDTPEVVRLQNQALHSGPIDAVLNPSGVLWSNGLRDLEAEAVEQTHEISVAGTERGIYPSSRIIDLNALVVPGARDEGLPDPDGEGDGRRPGRAPVDDPGEAHDALFRPSVPDELRGDTPLHDGDEGP